MPPDPENDQIESLLERYEDALGRGEAVSAEDLCRDCPELLSEVRRRVEALRRFAAWDTPTVVVIPKIGHYQIEACIGRGAMGEVYRAIHTEMDKVVALKVLPHDRAFSSEAIARFRRELKVLGQLGHHDNVVLSTDGGSFEGHHYLVMEFIDGPNLATVIGESERLPTSTACEYARQAALGLQYIHERGICHRDIKPSNLMLTRDDVVKVTDLGLALLEAPADRRSVDLTASDMTLGTFLYMAPEQARDSHSVDARADIYSLGATLYKLLTGLAPFEAPEGAPRINPLGALYEGRLAPPIASLRPDLPVDLARLIDRMISNDRDNRPASAAEVAAALEPFVSGSHKGDGGRNPPSSRQARFPAVVERPGRTRLAVGAAAVLLLVTLAVSVVISILTQIDIYKQITPAPADDLDREVAMTVFTLGGTVDVKPADADETPDIKSPERLPGPGSTFGITGIYGLQRVLDVGDAFVEKVSKLRQIGYLELKGAKRVTDTGVAHLKQAQTLTTLDLKETGVTDGGLLSVASLSFLDVLKLSDTVISDKNLGSLGSLKKLRELYLKHTRITNQGMSAIGRLKSLQVLDIRENDVDDRGLEHLQSLEHIRELWIEGTKITKDGISRFKAVRPDCDIHTHGRPGG